MSLWELGRPHNNHGQKSLIDQICNGQGNGHFCINFTIHIKRIEKLLKLKSFILQWRYCIRLENLGDRTVQLRERNWRIFSLSGTLETVRGRGVVGVEPVLSKEQPAFQYSSHVSLQAPSGHMWSVFNLFLFEEHTLRQNSNFCPDFGF